MSYFTELTWIDWIKDLIDVGIVSFIIYKLFLLVRGTRAVQLLKGIFVLAATWAVSTWFNLYTLKWLMSQMFTFGIITVILILFQPEVRRALEQLGRGKLFGRSNGADPQIHERINQLIKSLNYLSERKIGALIVFERQTGSMNT